MRYWFLSRWEPQFTKKSRRATIIETKSGILLKLSLQKISSG